MFLLREPAPKDLDAFLDRARTQPLSYSPGLTRQHRPDGFRVSEEHGHLGTGDDIFKAAAQLIQQWRQFDLGWVRLYPQSAPVATGTTVVVVAKHVGFWSLNGCRIVYTLPAEGEPGDLGGGKRIVGFAYGTLTDHAETGEEVFQVSIEPSTGAVTYLVRAVSRERALLAKLGAPLARAFQDRFRRESVAAMKRHIRA